MDDEEAGVTWTALVDNLVPKWHRASVRTAAQAESMIEPSRKRISARVPESVHELLSRAAASVGATVNQFVLQTALEEAHRILERETVIQLKQRDAEFILALLDKPPKPNRRLREAMKLFLESVGA
jgi:uncharacterized protein (DUF1778 family)